MNFFSQFNVAKTLPGHQIETGKIKELSVGFSAVNDPQRAVLLANGKDPKLLDAERRQPQQTDFQTVFA